MFPRSLLAPAVACICSITLAGPAAARSKGELIVKPSNRSVKETIDALAQAVEAAGAKVVGRVDHAAGAKAVGIDMKPAEVLMFGNPKLGTPLMQAAPRVGLDLPMKVLAYEDAKGKVWIVTTDAQALKRRFGIKGKDEVVAAMAGALEKLTGAAAGSASTPAAPAAPAKK